MHAQTAPAANSLRGSAAPDYAVVIANRFENFIKEADFPCVGAKSALAKRQMTAYVGRDIESAWDDVNIARELIDFAHDYAATGTLFRTFVCIFPESRALTEIEFEEALWARIASLRAKDEWMGQPYDEGVEPDPSSPKFSLSFGGQAFFAVGLHPGASRPARRFDHPAVVFNLHDQFERLRADGRYEPMRARIIERDVALAGTENPMLSRFGEVSEARQYSGRLVGPDWECPYPGPEGDDDAA